MTWEVAKEDLSSRSSPLILKLSVLCDHLESLLNHRLLPPSRVSEISRSGMGPTNCIRFPDDADTDTGTLV